MYQKHQQREPTGVVNAYRYYLGQLLEKQHPDKVKHHYNQHSEAAFRADYMIVQKLRNRGFSAAQIRRALRRANPALYGKSEAHARLYFRKFDLWLRQEQQRKQQIEREKRSQEKAKRYHQNQRRARQRRRGRSL